MLTLVETSYKEKELKQSFTEKRAKIQAQNVTQPPKYPMSAISVSDGFVYFFDGIYVFASNTNVINQLAVVETDHTGVILIDTKQVSKKHKDLLKSIESFLSILIPMLSKMTSNKIIDVDIKHNHTLSNFREDILRRNSL